MRVISRRGGGLLGLAPLRGHLPDAAEQRKRQAFSVRRPGGVGSPPGYRFVVRGGDTAATLPHNHAAQETGGGPEHQGSCLHAKQYIPVGMPGKWCA